MPEGGEGGEEEKQGNWGAGGFFFLDLWIPTQSQARQRWIVSHVVLISSGQSALPFLAF